MLILGAFLLWMLVSVHFVGAAFLFRRLFPRESRWLAFIVPEIVIVLACNFVEHHLALTVLRFLLPVTTIASICLIVASKTQWRVMRLPTWLFLAAFAFAFLLRVLRPDIEDSRDGTPDLSLIANFTFGQTLPVESDWLPPVKLLHYYFLEHYGASVLIRLLGVDIGTGFNICSALLSTYVFFLAGATAWLLSRGKLWIVILAAFFIACSATGDTGYLWLTVKDLDSENVVDPNSMLSMTPPVSPVVAGNWFLRQLRPIHGSHGHELLPPGFGAWEGCFHSAQAGQVVICISLLCLAELLRRKRSNWPWICLALSPLLMLTTCTWGMPMVGFVVLAGLIACLWMKIVPENPTFVCVAAAGLAMLLEPMLLYFLQWSLQAKLGLVQSGLHTQLPEFFGQWWPIFFPWLALFFIWGRLGPTTRIVLIMTPLAFAWVETCNLGWRGDMTGKSWGIIYTAAWLVIVPEIARQRAWPFRIILCCLFVGCTLSLGFWTTNCARSIETRSIGNLEGHGNFRLDERKAKILEILMRFDDQTIICGFADDDVAALLAEFSHNRDYATASMVCETTFYSNGLGEATRRLAELGDLYAGNQENPLYLLRQRNIAALVIFPDDNIGPWILDRLKVQLAPYYTYEDTNPPLTDQQKNGDAPKPTCSGVFIYHPEIAAQQGLAGNIGEK